MNVCDPQLRHFAVARQRAPIWLQRYEKTIKPVPFSVVIDVFSVSYQRSHYSSLIAQRHEFSPSVVANTLRTLMVSDKRTYLSVGQYSYEAYVLMSDSLFYFGCWLIAFLSLVYCALLPVPFPPSADLPILHRGED